MQEGILLLGKILLYFSENLFQLPVGGGLAEGGPGIPEKGTLLAVENIIFRFCKKALFHQSTLHLILDAFHAGDILFGKPFLYGMKQIRHNGGGGITSGTFKCLFHGGNDFMAVIGFAAAVALCDFHFCLL